MSVQRSDDANITISLHCPPALANTPSFSGYCQKLETVFRLTSFEKYSLVPTNFQSSPTGKLPYITIHHPTTQPEIIPDSHFILRTLITRGIIEDPDSGLTPEQKTESRAQCVWIEQHVYLAVVHQRWARQHNATLNIAALPVPLFIRPLLGWYLRRNIVSSLWTAGIGRYTDEQVDEFIIEWLDGLEVKLADGRTWLMGVGMEPGIVDATVWGFLINFVGVGEGNREVLGWIKARKGVCEYIRRGAAQWFPEYNMETMMGMGNDSDTVY